MHELRIAEDLQGTLHQVPGGRLGQRAMQGVRLGQQGNVGVGEFAHQTVCRRTVGQDPLLARA